MVSEQLSQLNQLEWGRRFYLNYSRTEKTMLFEDAHVSHIETCINSISGLSLSAQSIVITKCIGQTRLMRLLYIHVYTISCKWRKIYSFHQCGIAIHLETVSLIRLVYLCLCFVYTTTRNRRERSGGKLFNEIFAWCVLWWIHNDNSFIFLISFYLFSWLRLHGEQL